MDFDVVLMFVLVTMSVADAPAASQSRNSSAENGGLVAFGAMASGSVADLTKADLELCRQRRPGTNFGPCEGVHAASGALEFRLDF